MEVKLPFVLEKRVILRPGKFKGVFFPAQELETLPEKLNVSPEEAEDRNFNSLFLDHEEGKVSTWVGTVKNFFWDAEAEFEDTDQKGALKADLEIADLDLATKLKYQEEEGIFRFAISPHLFFDLKDGKATNIRFAGISLTPKPAGGDPLFLDEEEVELQDWEEPEEALEVELHLSEDQDKLNFSASVPFLSWSPEEKVAFGPVLIPDYRDKQGHCFTRSGIEKAHEVYMEFFQTLGLMHKSKDGNYLISLPPEEAKNIWSKEIHLLESYITPASFYYEDRYVPWGTWLMKAKVTDPYLAEKLTEGKISGFSPAGYFPKEEAERGFIENPVVTEVSLVERPAGERFYFVKSEEVEEMEATKHETGAEEITLQRAELGEILTPLNQVVSRIAKLAGYPEKPEKYPPPYKASEEKLEEEDTLRKELLKELETELAKTKEEVDKVKLFQLLEKAKLMFNV